MHLATYLHPRLPTDSAEEPKTDGPALPDARVSPLDPLGHQSLLLVVEPGHEGQRRQHLRGVDVRIVLGQVVSDLHGGVLRRVPWLGKGLRIQVEILS